MPPLPVVETFPPSHILQDGTFANLPEPSKLEHIRFFERSIARYGLLGADLKLDDETDDGGTDGKAKDDDEDDDDRKKEIEQPKIHPLMMASARLQSSGINELNRAINLSNLAGAGEYFRLTNIVESSIGDTNKHVQALYVLKRKRRAFQMASVALTRHRKRLAAALVVQSQPDQRLRRLRPHWRLVAPEHGTRALAHAPRPTEVIAADVDVYLQTRTSFGRLAKGVPRYATIELAEKYCVKKHLAAWKRLHKISIDQQEHDAMEIEAEETAPSSTAPVANAAEAELPSTRAEAFAIADPSLGKIDADFDPSKVTMLTLQLDIEKPSTGFCQSHCLEPLSSLTVSGPSEDEHLLVSLQHSLFCARLFESIRRELAPDTEHIGQLRTTAKAQTAVWLSGESDENFVPPESQVISNAHSLAPLCVVHVHEGDVKVLLDCEYALRVRLVEPKSTPVVNLSSDSGSQSPEQLLTLCKILLVNGQERYHRHSVAATAKAMGQDESQKAGDKKAANEDEPRILQNCVSLFTNVVFERRVRNVIQAVNTWIVETLNKPEDRLNVQWLALSIFELASHFTLTFRSWTCDCTLLCDEMTVTQFRDDGSRRKVQFHSDNEFELFVKMAIQKIVRSIV